jgi:hypothetical protein
LNVSPQSLPAGFSELSDTLIFRNTTRGNNSAFRAFVAKTAWSIAIGSMTEACFKSPDSPTQPASRFGIHPRADVCLPGGWQARPGPPMNAENVHQVAQHRALKVSVQIIQRAVRF